MIVAGSPFQQLTYAGRHRGKQGLCGPDSVLFFAVPAAAWQLQQIRPDLQVHVTLENASGMQQLHRDAIMQALGGPTAAEHLQTMGSTNWSAFPRRRYCFVTIPDRDPAPNPDRRDNPWDAGWGPIPSAVMGPMMCSRNPRNPRPSTIQYYVQSLIYRYAENDSDFDWHAWQQTQVRNRMLNTMPSELRSLCWRLFNPGTGGFTYDEERRLEPVMTWIDEQGPRLGYRVPTPNERARSTGRFNYLTALRFSEVQLFNAVENHFDPDALRARIKGPLRKVFMSEVHRQHAFPSPADLAIIYHSVAKDVARMEIPVADAAFPPDLMRQLIASFYDSHAGGHNVSQRSTGRYNMTADSGHSSQ